MIWYWWRTESKITNRINSLAVYFTDNRHKKLFPRTKNTWKSVVPIQKNKMCVCDVLFIWIKSQVWCDHCCLPKRLLTFQRTHFWHLQDVAVPSFLYGMIDVKVWGHVYTILVTNLTILIGPLPIPLVLDWAALSALLKYGSAFCSRRCCSKFLATAYPFQNTMYNHSLFTRFTVQGNTAFTETMDRFT